MEGSTQLFIDEQTVPQIWWGTAVLGQSSEDRLVGHTHGRNLGRRRQEYAMFILAMFIMLNTGLQGLVALRDKRICTYTKSCYVTLFFNLKLLVE